MAVGDEQPGEPRGGVTADGPDEAVNEGGAGGEENIKGQLASLQEHFQRLQQEAVDVETQQSHQIAVLNSTIQGMQRKNENLLEQLDDLTVRTFRGPSLASSWQPFSLARQPLQLSNFDSPSASHRSASLIGMERFRTCKMS